MGYLHQALSAVKHKIGDDLMDRNDSNEETNLDKRKQRDIDNNANISLSTDDLINCITAPEVINEMTVQVLQKIGISRPDDVPLESWPTQEKKTAGFSYKQKEQFRQEASRMDQWSISLDKPQNSQN